MVDRILIVDDEKMIYSLVAQRLAKEGYSCMMANNGREALGYFCDYHFSLIISDFRMTEMSGLELLRKVREVRPNMMFIIMTGFPEIDIVVEAIHLGATDFIIKPIDLELLIFSVKKALDKKSMQEEIEAHQKNLEKLVEEKTGELRETLIILRRLISTQLRHWPELSMPKIRTPEAIQIG